VVTGQIHTSREQVRRLLKIGADAGLFVAMLVVSAVALLALALAAPLAIGISALAAALSSKETRRRGWITHAA
jgi:hypothetical protein